MLAVARQVDARIANLDLRECSLLYRVNIPDEDGLECLFMQEYSVLRTPYSAESVQTTILVSIHK